MARFVPIKEIAADHFVIPDFQRDYAWERENLELMLDDIKEACRLDKPQYVLGPLVVSDTGKKVVDGQQRLTSLVIILKALGEGNVGFLDFENRERTRKILAALSNQQGGDELDSLINDHPTCAKIWEMYRFAQDYFASSFADDGEKKRFCGYLMERVCFIEKRLGKDAEIQHTFEVLNTAGEQLKKEDIAKANLIADIVDLGHEKEAELLNFAWGLCCDLVRDLDDDEIKNGKDVAKKINDIYAADSLENLSAVMDFVQKSGIAGRFL